MSHLSPERLAALLDEQPTAAELSHLAMCQPCSQERGAYEALSAMSSGATTIGKPLTSWDRLAPALRRDGVIDTGRGLGRPSRFAGVTRAWLQAAAAVLLIAGGVVAGRMTAPSSEPVSMVSAADAEAPTFRTVAEAEAAARRSQALYQASVAFLAQHDTEAMAASTPNAIVAKVAAYDRVRQALSVALEEAPYDPVINAMYLNAETQRDASVRQLNSAAMRFTSY